MVAAAQDDTTLTIEDRNGNFISSVTLNDVEVYTVRSTVTDFTGYRILSDKPVGVISGNSQVMVGEVDQYIAESMPGVHQLGTHYLTYPVPFGRLDTGYIVKVLSIEDDTLVDIVEMGISTILHK